MGFDQKQVAEYQEAFGVIDKDGDGTIDVKELKACFEELGTSVKDAELKAMVAESKGPLDFKSFLGLFEAKMGNTDSDAVILEAFKLFDNSGSGSIPEALLRELLTQNGRPADRLTDAEVNQVLEGASNGGKVDYAAVTNLIKNGK